MCILSYTTKPSIIDITQVLLFYKRYVYPFHVIHLLNPKHAKFHCVRVYVSVYVGQGAIFMLLFLMHFFQIHS